MTVKCHCDADVGSVVEYKTTCRRQSANLVRFFGRYGHPQGVPNFGLGLLRQLAFVPTDIAGTASPPHDGVRRGHSVAL